MNILIVKLSAIGDIVHSLPSLAAIREHLPDARIKWIVERRAAELLRGNEMIDELIEVDTRMLRGGRLIKDFRKALGTQIRGLRREKIDAALDIQGLLKSAVIAKLSGAERRIGFVREHLREPAARLFMTETVAVPPFTHVIRKNLLLASAAFGFSMPTELSFPIVTFDEHREEAERIRDEAGGRFAILNPGGGWVTKLWHAEKYGALADSTWEEFGIRTVVTGGPDDGELVERVLANSRSGKAFAAAPSLKGFYETAKLAEIYVGGDTGPTHIAVAAGTPTVGIFGPTEWWRNGSLNPDDICVERTDIGCRVDCHRRECSNWICMDISVETVADAVRKRLAAKAVNDNKSNALPKIGL